MTGRVRPPLARWSAGLRVGADFFARRGAVVATAPAPRGVVDRIDDLRNPAIDVARVPPEVIAFFEDTVGLELHIRSRWRFPFSLGWRLFRPVMRWIGQFVLPIGDGRVVVRETGSGSAGHFGLVVLLREGVAAWMADGSRRSTRPASTQVRANDCSPVAPVISDELRDDMALVLASMVMTAHEERCA